MAITIRSLLERGGDNEIVIQKSQIGKAKKWAQVVPLGWRSEPPDFLAFDQYGNYVQMMESDEGGDFCVMAETKSGKELAHTDGCVTRGGAMKKFWEYVSTYLK